MNQHVPAGGAFLAFGYQPDLDVAHGTAFDVFHSLQARGTKARLSLGCPGETSATFIAGHCLYTNLRKFPGRIRPVTLDVSDRALGNLILLNDDDPFANRCAGLVADVFAAFGGSAVPNPGLCAATCIFRVMTRNIQRSASAARTRMHGTKSTRKAIHEEVDT